MMVQKTEEYIKELEGKVKFLESLVMDRFWSKIDKTDSCWNWKGCLIGGGYGRYLVNGKPEPAHRVSYELTFGKIPEGLIIDHLCRNKKCVNPEHLEAVTYRENALRGVGVGQYTRHLLTHCKRGHEYTPENTYYRSNSNYKTRDCKKCHKIRNDAWRARKKCQ